MAGHVAPEAAQGGDRSRRCRDGDTIVFDLQGRELRVEVDEVEIARTHARLAGPRAAVRDRRHGEVLPSRGFGGRRRGCDDGVRGRGSPRPRTGKGHGKHENRRADSVGIPRSRGSDHGVRVSGRRDSARLRRPARVPGPARPGAARAGRDPHGRRLCAGQRRGRGGGGHVRAPAPRTWSPASPPRCSILRHRVHHRAGWAAG